MSSTAPLEDLLRADAPPIDDYLPTFYVGHHESRRPLPIVNSVLRQAQDVGVSEILSVNVLF
jgi:protein arginine N-methyltransferase 5